MYKTWTDSNNITRFRSDKGYNWNLDNKNGYFERWGNTEEENPTWSPFGPEILDQEISSICSAGCSYCYKSNTSSGKNLSLKDFKRIVNNINPFGNLRQVAFGTGSTGIENPEIWDMCEFLKANGITPNCTFANINEDTADNIVKYMGACAISFHKNFKDPYNLLANQVDMLSKRGFKQVNIHFVISQETLDDCYKLVEMIKSDSRFSGLRALVLLGLKVCGRAKENQYNTLTFGQIEVLIKSLIGRDINIGFDSCQGPIVEKVFRNMKSIPEEKINSILQCIEPCESFGMFSSYVDVNGIYSPCSFCAGIKDTAHFDCINTTQEKFVNFWREDSILSKLREESISKERNCLYYSITQEEK